MLQNKNLKYHKKTGKLFLLEIKGEVYDPYFISKNLTTVIFSRRAASYFVAFNTDNTIDAASVFRSTLRSSNLSFGALQ